MRKAIETVSKKRIDNVSLAIDRYTRVEQAGSEKAEQKEMLTRIAEVGPSKVYEGRYKTWRKAVESLPDMLVLDFRLVTPMAVGLGNETVLENGLAFNRIYGMPMIPGSSLKGLLRRAAADLFGIRIADDQWDPGDDDATARAKMGPSWNETMETWRALFGSPDAMAGLVVFDAWLKPTETVKPFRVDVLTPHHREYYAGKQPLPLDSDQPNPVSFLSVRPQTVFTFAIQLPSEEWRDAMTSILRHAVAHLGVGAKSNSGYGYFRKGPETDKAKASSAQPPATEPTPSVALEEGTRTVEVTLLSKVKNGSAKATWEGHEFQVEKFLPGRVYSQGDKVTAKVVVRRGRVERATYVPPGSDA